MIPLADENPTRTQPYIVYALIALNVLVYLIDISGSGSPMGGRLWEYSLVPRSVVQNAPTTITYVGPVTLPNGQTILARVPVEHQGLNPQWLTIFTSMFMHGGLLHIGGNMLYLWIFGNNIEDALGHFKFLIFYLICGVFAAAAQILSAPSSTTPMVGASGAIAGVLGAYLLLYPSARVKTLILLGFFWDVAAIPAVFVLGLWFVIQLVGLGGSGGQLGGGVAYWAHVGGFAAGVIIALLLGGRGITQRRSSYYYQSKYPG